MDTREPLLNHHRSKVGNEVEPDVHEAKHNNLGRTMSDSSRGSAQLPMLTPRSSLAALLPGMGVVSRRATHEHHGAHANGGSTIGSGGSSSSHHSVAVHPKAQSLLARLLIIAACLGWMSSSSMLILLNRRLMVTRGFNYPISVAAMGMVASTLLSSLVCLGLRLVPLSPVRMPIHYYVTRVIPAGFFMALTFYTGNAGYLYLTVAFVQILKAFAPVVTMLLLFVVRMEDPTLRLVAAVCMIAAGVSVASYGEVHMSVIGLIAMITSVVAEGIRLVLTQVLLAGRSFHPLEGLMYMAPACATWLLLMAAFIEMPTILANGSWAIALQFPGEFATAACLGFACNTLAVVVIKLASSLTLKVLGTVKDALLVAFGIVFLGETVTGLQAVGYGIALSGFVWYNLIQAGSHAAKAGHRHKK